LAIIETRGLTKYYGKTRGIENLTMEVESGEIFGYLGPNGAGKTTTIRTLLGFLKPTGGEARVLGTDIEEDIVEIKRQVGYVPGDLSLYGGLTGREFLDFFSSLKGSDEDLLDVLLERFQVPLDREIQGYSRGMKQKVAIIQAFMNDPELVIMDEPTAGLDPLMQETVYEFLREQKERGRTVFFSSHILSEVDKICDRVGIVREGKLVALEDIQSLKDKRGKRVRVKIEGDPRSFEGPKDTSTEDEWIEFVVEDDINPWIRELAKFNVLDLEVENFSLEDIFMRYYEEGG
jgi:ABC-2 type transport system ATP-binding protein